MNYQLDVLPAAKSKTYFECHIHGHDVPGLDRDVTSLYVCMRKNTVKPNIYNYLFYINKHTYTNTYLHSHKHTYKYIYRLRSF